MREIEGTLWVDRQSAELRTLEFRVHESVRRRSRRRIPAAASSFCVSSDGNWLDQPLERSHAAARRGASRLERRTATVGDDGDTDRRSRRAGDRRRGHARDARRQFALPATGPHVDAAGCVDGHFARPSRQRTLTLEGTDYAARADAAGRIRSVAGARRSLSGARLDAAHGLARRAARSRRRSRRAKTPMWIR